MDGAEAVGLQRLEPQHESSLISNSSSRKTTLVPLFGANFCRRKISFLCGGFMDHPLLTCCGGQYTIDHMYQLVLINASATRLTLKSIRIATV